MMPISGVNTNAAQPLTTVEKILGVPKDQKSEEAHGRPLKPVMDEYVPEKPQEPSGRYWLGKDEDGKPKIYFDDPERAADASEEPDELSGAENPKDELPDTDSPDKGREAGGSGKKAANSKKAEICRGSTDAVDREIEKLKKKREELERQINSETDDTKVKELERKLAQVESELRQKDNDTYRRQHSTFS